MKRLSTGNRFAERRSANHAELVFWRRQTLLLCGTRFRCLQWLLTYLVARAFGWALFREATEDSIKEKRNIIREATPDIETLGNLWRKNLFSLDIKWQAHYFTELLRLHREYWYPRAHELYRDG